MNPPRLSERGATAVEYGLLIALLAAVIVFAVVALGGGVVQLFEKTNASMGSISSRVVPGYVVDSRITSWPERSAAAIASVAATT